MALKFLRRNTAAALAALALLSSEPTVAQMGECDVGTELVDVAGTDMCQVSPVPETGDIYLAGIFDDGRESGGYPRWTKHHFDLAVDMINNKTDGFHDDLFTSTRLHSHLPLHCTAVHSTAFLTDAWRDLQTQTARATAPRSGPRSPTLAAARCWARALIGA